MWTTITDVIGSWIGDDAPTDLDKVSIWIDRAERLLKRRIPTLALRLEADEEDLIETLADVVSNMVQRVFRNPEGYRQRNFVLGPQTEQATYGGDQPGYLWVTDEELSSLTNGETGTGLAFMVDTLPPTAGSVYSLPESWA